MSVKLLTKQHLEFLGLKGGCTGSSESTFVKMPHCWKSHVTAQLIKGNVCHCLTYHPVNTTSYHFGATFFKAVCLQGFK